MLESVRSLFRINSVDSWTCLKRILSKAGSSTVIPSRTTIIVKRPFPPTLYKEGNKPRLRTRTFYLDFVEDTNTRPEPLIDVVLSTYVQGVGNPGDLVSMKRSAAYNQLLIPGLADFATPDVIERAKKIKEEAERQGHQISVTMERSITYLQRQNLSVVVNQFNEWTIEPWHIRVSARKAGIHILSDDCIELPPKPIKGPDMALEGKQFFVTITINKKAKVKVKCVIHHWTANPTERLPFVPQWWLTEPEMVFPEDEKIKKDDSPPLNSS